MNLQFLENKKVLIVGATGVVGYNLCKTIHENSNCQIHVNFKSQIPKMFELLFSHFIKYQFDLEDYEKIDSLPKFDYIFFCSGYGQPKKFTIDNSKTFNINTSSVFRLLNKTEENGKFIFISSSEIYADGDGNSENSKITLDLDSPRSGYITSKIFGELICKNFKSKIECKNIRLCLCYGEGFKNNDERVLSEFIFKAVDTGSIQLMDDGSDSRSYIYAEDCINGILNIAELGQHDTYNIGGEDIITIKHLAEKISEITDSNVILGSINNKLSGSPSKACVDISRYEKEFGKLNKTNFTEGLRRCVEWYKNYE